jgi:hypothetical protein
MQYTVALNAAGVNRADLRPNLYTGAGAAYTSGFPATVGGQAPAIFSLSYTQSIFNLPLRGQLKAAEDRAASQKIELDRTRDAVIVRTATTYLELAKVRTSLELLRGEGASAEKIAGVTRERAEAGQELPIEITRSQLTLARIREPSPRSAASDSHPATQNLTARPANQFVETEPTSFAVDQQESDDRRRAQDQPERGRKGTRCEAASPEGCAAEFGPLLALSAVPQVPRAPTKSEFFIITQQRDRWNRRAHSNFQLEDFCRHKASEKPVERS